MNDIKEKSEYKNESEDDNRVTKESFSKENFPEKNVSEDKDKQLHQSK
jgi:hypothetical protein